jgi:cation diffusion facilitator CzcD-associated flavoprotein CzcO
MTLLENFEDHPTNTENSVYDAVIVGAGLTGLYQLYKLLELGYSVRLFEYGSGVGGTWYWNRYPGACFDSESEIYSYSFSKELLEEWDWKHHYSHQGDTEEYYNYVADRFDLRRHIQFEARVKGGVWHEQDRQWEIELESGERVRARFFLPATGMLSGPARYTPSFPGAETFEGEVYHSSDWPKEEVSFAGKRIALFGTGSSGVQIMPIAAKDAEHLTVFQRTPTYCAPLRNAPVSEETQQRWKASYDQILTKAKNNARGYTHEPDPRAAMDVPKEERWAFYEECWEKPGFAKWMTNFHDITRMSGSMDTSDSANADYSEFVWSKIAAQIDDPEVARKLKPDHPFGAKRTPMESGYYAAFNRPNVSLVSVRETPVERITQTGIVTSDGVTHEVDMIIYATGFDALSGGLTRMDIVGTGGQTLADEWANGPRTYLNLGIAGFPNFFTAIPRNFCNYPRCAEAVVEWIAECIAYLDEHGRTRIEPEVDAEREWGTHVAELAEGMVMNSLESWFNGGNIPGKKHAFLVYPGTAPEFKRRISEAAQDGYRGFKIS